MIYTDLYGRFDIPKKAEEIIFNPRFVRLFDIAQEGPARYLSHNQNRNRGQHSIGVAYIISKLGGNEEEIIAGVIHDIGHFPMAHAIDNELSKRDHDTHEREDILKLILENWEIGEFNLFEISRKIKRSYYKRLENEMPRVCADRLEYTLRDGYYLGYISKEDIRDIILDIRFKDEITLSKENAIKLFDLYFKLNINHYMDNREAVMHAIYGKIINEVIQRENLSIKQLLSMTDTELNQLITIYYPFVKNLNKMTIVPGNQYTIYPKYRIIDPLTHDGKRVSEFYENFDEVKKILKEKSKPRCFNIFLNE